MGITPGASLAVPRGGFCKPAFKERFQKQQVRRLVGRLTDLHIDGTAGQGEGRPRGVTWVKLPRAAVSPASRAARRTP